MTFNSLVCTTLLFFFSVNILQAQKTRSEYDELGKVEIPSSAYYGIHSARNMKHLTISRESMSDYPSLIKGMGIVKLAAAKANADAGLLDKNKLTFIEKATQSLIYGGKWGQFQLDAFQGNPAVSLNMAANEILANSALEMQGLSKGSYKEMDPVNELNQNQDAVGNYFSAANIGTVLQNEELIKVLETFVSSLDEKSAEFEKDGVSFNSFSKELNGNIAQLQFTSSLLHIHFMGIDFEGDGKNDDFAQACSQYIGQISKLSFSSAHDQFGLALNIQSSNLYSASLRSLAVTLSSLSTYIIDLATENPKSQAAISLPKLPTENTRTNNVDILALNVQVCATAIGNDATASAATSMEQMSDLTQQALITKSILESQSLLKRHIALMQKQCISGMELNN